MDRHWSPSEGKNRHGATNHSESTIVAEAKPSKATRTGKEIRETSYPQLKEERSYDNLTLKVGGTGEMIALCWKTEYWIVMPEIMLNDWILNSNTWNNVEWLNIE